MKIKTKTKSEMKLTFSPKELQVVIHALDRIAQDYNGSIDYEQARLGHIAARLESKMAGTWGKCDED